MNGFNAGFLHLIHRSDPENLDLLRFYVDLANLTEKFFVFELHITLKQQ